MAKKGGLKLEFRDVSAGIQKLRQFLLGRKYVYHNRFPSLISPRTIPPPDVPRGPEYKYSNQTYARRSVLESVKPPVVAPVAEGRRKAKGNQCPSKVVFDCPPTPGMPWWFDGHCYYEFVKAKPTSPPPPPDPCDNTSQNVPPNCPDSNQSQGPCGQQQQPPQG